MNSYGIKFKHIMPAFFIIVPTSTVGLILIRWLVDFQFHFLSIKEEVWEFWLPFFLPWISILIWLRPKLRIINYKDNDKGRFGMQTLTWMTMTAMMIVSQSFLTTASGKMTLVSNVNEIGTKEKTRYYKINSFSVTRNFGGTHATFNTSGKYGHQFNFNLFFVTPIVNDTNKHVDVYQRLWYCVKFQETVSNSLSKYEKQKKYETFYSECLKKMQDYPFHDLDHFERVPISDDRENFSKAVDNATHKKSAKELVLLRPVSGSYESRNKSKLPWVFGIFAIGSTVTLLLLFFGTIDYAEYRDQQHGVKPEKDDLIDVLRFLIPKNDHFATSVVLDLNIAVFLIMIFSGVNILSPQAIDLLHWGGNRRAETLGGDWWRLVTSLFIHNGIAHILGNIFGLVIAALFVEPLFGRWNFFILYFISGICASLTSTWWHPDSISVGASGAIFGLYGAVLASVFADASPKKVKWGMFIFIGAYIGINLLIGLTGAIDNAAHLGGLISGVACGFLLYKFNPRIEDPRDIL